MGKMSVNGNGSCIAGFWNASSLTPRWNEEQHADLISGLRARASHRRNRPDPSFRLSKEAIMPRTSNPGHLTKHFNTQICEAFSMDLGRYIEKGFPDNESEANRQWLRDITAAAAAIPDAELRGKRVQQRCEAIAETYDRWNARDGTPELRARHHRRIRRKVDKLAYTYRRRTALLEQKADPAIYRAFYEATEKLLQATPTVWSAVPQTFAKYPKPS
jgi:hypothetical protein